MWVTLRFMSLLLHEDIFICFWVLWRRLKTLVLLFVVPNGHEAEVKIEPNTADMNVSNRTKSTYSTKALTHYWFLWTSYFQYLLISISLNFNFLKNNLNSNLMVLLRSLVNFQDNVSFFRIDMVPSPTQTNETTQIRKWNSGCPRHAPNSDNKQCTNVPRGNTHESSSKL